MSRTMFDLPLGGKAISIMRVFEQAELDEESFKNQLTSGHFIMSPVGESSSDGYTMREQLLCLGLMCDKFALTDTVSDRDEPLKLSKAVRALLNKPVNKPLSIPKEVEIPGNLMLGRRGINLFHPNAFFKADDSGITTEEGAFQRAVHGVAGMTDLPPVDSLRSRGTELILVKQSERGAAIPIDGIPSIKKKTVDKLVKAARTLKSYDDIVALTKAINFRAFDNSLTKHKDEIHRLMGPIYQAVSQEGDSFISISPVGDPMEYVPVSLIFTSLNHRDKDRRDEARIILFVLLTSFSDIARRDSDIDEHPIPYSLVTVNEEEYPPIEEMVYRRLGRIFDVLPHTYVNDAGGLFRIMDYDEIVDRQTSVEVYKIQRALYTGDLFASSLDRVFSATDRVQIDVAIGAGNKDSENPLSASAGDGIRTDKKEGDDEKPIHLYGKKTVSIELALLAAYGNPKTYADILHYYQDRKSVV